MKSLFDFFSNRKKKEEAAEWEEAITKNTALSYAIYLNHYSFRNGKHIDEAKKRMEECSKMEQEEEKKRKEKELAFKKKEDEKERTELARQQAELASKERAEKKRLALIWQEIENCNKHLEVTPNDEEAILLRAKCYFSIGDYTSALKDYKYLIQRHVPSADFSVHVPVFLPNYVPDNIKEIAQWVRAIESNNPVGYWDYIWQYRKAGEFYKEGLAKLEKLEDVFWEEIKKENSEKPNTAYQNYLSIYGGWHDFSYKGKHSKEALERMESLKERGRIEYEKNELVEIKITRIDPRFEVRNDANFMTQGDWFNYVEIKYQDDDPDYVIDVESQIQYGFVKIPRRFINSTPLEIRYQTIHIKKDKPKKYKSEKLRTISEKEKEENRLKKRREIEKRMKEIGLLAENEVPFWEDVKKINSEEAVRSYITEYPNGKFLDEAIEILNKLKNKPKGDIQNTEVSKKEIIKPLATMFINKEEKESIRQAEFAHKEQEEKESLHQKAKHVRQKKEEEKKARKEQEGKERKIQANKERLERQAVLAHKEQEEKNIMFDFFTDKTAFFEKFANFFHKELLEIIWQKKQEQATEFELRNSGYSDFSPLQVLINLQELNVSYSKVSDLNPFKGLTKLQKLDASNTQVSDLSPLKNLTDLENLDVSNTQVSDLRGQRKITSPFGFAKRRGCFNFGIA